MKKDRLLKAAALGAALITCLSGFTSRPVTQNKLPDVLNPLAKTMAEVADGISKAKTISFGKFGGYTDQTTLLNPDSAGSFGSLTVKETTRSNLEKTELSFSKASGIMTLFDFTLTASEKHTISIDSDLAGKAKIILTKDNKNHYAGLGIDRRKADNKDIDTGKRTLSCPPGCIRSQWNHCGFGG